MTSSEEQIKIWDKTFSILLPNEVIMQRIGEISEQLNQDYAGKRPVFIPVLTGAFAFASHIVLKFSHDCEVDFVKTQSYSGLLSTGEVKIDANFKTALNGRHLLIIEDIVDSGLTMLRFLHFLKEHYQPASVKIITLFDKPACRQHQLDVYLSGFEIDPLFIVGFGLDYDGLGRNLPHIYQIVKP